MACRLAGGMAARLTCAGRWLQTFPACNSLWGEKKKKKKQLCCINQNVVLTNVTRAYWGQETQTNLGSMLLWVKGPCLTLCERSIGVNVGRRAGMYVFLLIDRWGLY